MVVRAVSGIWFINEMVVWALSEMIYQWDGGMGFKWDMIYQRDGGMGFESDVIYQWDGSMGCKWDTILLVRWWDMIY